MLYCGVHERLVNRVYGDRRGSRKTFLTHNHFVLQALLWQIGELRCKNIEVRFRGCAKARVTAVSTAIMCLAGANSQICDPLLNERIG